MGYNAPLTKVGVRGRNSISDQVFPCHMEARMPVSSVKENSQERVGVMLVGLGALASTLVAGIEAIGRGMARPIGSLTQLYRVNGDGNNALLRDVLPMAPLANLEFAAWDIFPD